MKTCIIISGEARFCKSTDLFIESIKDQSIDWFFYFWKDCIVPNVVPPDWRSIPSEEWATTQIQSKLPDSHRVVSLKLAVPDPATKYSQFYAWTLVNELKKKYEEEHGKYDLAIKSRPDIHVTGNLNLQEMKQHVDQNPMDVIIPENLWWGTDRYRINDCFAVSSSDNISYYSGLHPQITEHIASGNLNGQYEELLCYHLIAGNYNIKSWNIQTSLRQSGVPVGSYHPDFGSW